MGTQEPEEFVYAIDNENNMELVRNRGRGRDPGWSDPTWGPMIERTLQDDWIP